MSQGQMRTADVRVVDSILTEIARGYSNLEMIGFELFPRVPVTQRGGRILTFGKEAFMQYANLARAPGSNTRRVQFGYAGAPFTLVDYSLEAIVPVEIGQEAEAGPNIDLSALSVANVQAIIALNLELMQAALATNAANYNSSNKVTLSGTAQWSDTSGTSNPFAVVTAAKEAIRAKTGRYPNVLEIGPKVFTALQVHPMIVGRLQFTSTAVATEQILAALLGVDKVVVGKAITADDSGNFTDVWGKHAILAYTPAAGARAQGSPSYGYTYQLSNMPMVEEAYMERNVKSWVYPVDDCMAPVIAGQDAGYLIANAVA